VRHTRSTDLADTMPRHVAGRPLYAVGGLQVRIQQMAATAGLKRPEGRRKSTRPRDRGVTTEGTIAVGVSHDQLPRHLLSEGARGA
jgi:hypothetical protein